MKNNFQWLMLVIFFKLIFFGNIAASQTLADVSAGKHRAAACFACHGEDGVSKIPGTPHLAGQDRAYLEKALNAYRNGARQDPSMTAMAKPLSDNDIVNIAAYFHLAIRDGRGHMLSEALSTQQRILPVARIAMAESASVSSSNAAEHAVQKETVRSGKDIYKNYCVTCHGTGLAGAPKFGDKGAWQSYVSLGNDSMLANLIKGSGAMPPKGMCTSCSEEELKQAIDYLLYGK